jgi:hypothetical protein
MEVFNSDSYLRGSSVTMIVNVSASDSFTFSNGAGFYASVLYDHGSMIAESETAHTVEINRERVVIYGDVNFDYRLDTDFINGTARGEGKSADGGSVSLALTNEGILANGISAGSKLAMFIDEPFKEYNYQIPSGHDQVLITGSADDAKAFAVDGTEIKLSKIVPQQPKWWQTLPTWLQWVFRYVFFGWLWMERG